MYVLYVAMDSINTCVCLHLFANVDLLTYLHVSVLPARDLVVSLYVYIICIHVLICSSVVIEKPSMKFHHVPSCTSWILLAQLVPAQNHQFLRHLNLVAPLYTRPVMAYHGFI